MSDQRRYVVLWHEGIDNPHFDFMCEWRDHSPLITLRYESWPPDDPNRFERLPDHRRKYLDYEGPISSNRGFVSRVAAGFCTIEIDREDTALVQLDSGLKIRVAGARWD